MTPAQRQARLLAALPLLLQEGANTRELLAALARVLSGEPDEGGLEYGVTRVLRSRWHALAAGWAKPDLGDILGSELARLGALFGFPPYNDEAPDRYRRRLVEFIAIHRSGLTTAAAVLRLVALVYDAEEPPTLTWEPGRYAPAQDEAGRATWEPCGRVVTAKLRARDVAGELREVHVELVDNPSAPASAEFRAAPPGATLIVRNAGLDRAIPEIRLTPAADARAPVLKHLNTGLHLIYVGVVKKGQTLTLRNQLPPLIDGVPQPAPVILTNPFTFDAPTSLFEHAVFSTARRDSTLPALDPGETTWRYDTLTPDELAAFLSAWPALVPLAALAASPRATPPADLSFRWRETIPASFALRVPADFVSQHFFNVDGEGVRRPDLSAQVRWLERALAYTRAAGVRARVELALPYIRERLSVADALSFEASVSRGEALPIDERAPPPEIGILLTDHLPEAAEELSFSGHYDATYFDTSLFATAETEP